MPNGTNTGLDMETRAHIQLDANCQHGNKYLLSTCLPNDAVDQTFTNNSTLVYLSLSLVYCIFVGFCTIFFRLNFHLKKLGIYTQLQGYEKVNTPQILVLPFFNSIFDKIKSDGTIQNINSNTQLKP